MPKKAKKGGGGKGGGRTDRLESLQQRAQAEEEMAKKREETLIQFLKDKLEKEEKNTAENLRKLNEGWRGILRQTRDPELRQEIITFSQTFERQLEGLDSVIKGLTHDLQENERRSAQGRRVHLQRLGRLSVLHNRRMMFVQQHWENGMQCLSSRFYSEGMQMVAHSKQQRTDLEGAAVTVEQQHKEVMDEIHKVYSDGISALEKAIKEKDMVENREKIEDKEALVKKEKIKAEERLREKEKLKRESHELKEALKFFHQKTEDVENMTISEQLYLQETAEKLKKVKQLQHSVIKLREKLKSSQTEKETEQQDLKASNNEVNKKTHNLRQQLSQSHSVARKQLIHLTVQSNSAIKKLQAVIAKGERVLRVAEMCSKLERKHENILTSSSSPAAAENHRSVTEEEKHSNLLSQEECQGTPEFPELQQLTRRINTALLVRVALKKQREDLSRQNEQLRLQLRRQVEDMSVGDHALATQHALLTVSQAPTTTAPPDSTRRRNITKAVHVVSHTASTKKS